MKTAQWALLVGVGLVGTTSALAPAKAGGIIWFHGEDCSPGTKPKHAKPEWKGEAKFVTMFEKLNCCELAGFAESQRFVMNQQALGAYMRPLSSFGMSPAPAPPSPAAPTSTSPAATMPTATPAPASSPTSTPDSSPAPLPDAPASGTGTAPK